MIVTGSRLRQIGWIVVLTVCLTVFVALNFRVRAVVSEVRLAEREIIALEKDKIILETEFQARANQQQLANWNKIEFGYHAPNASQFLENERQLASLGTPRGINAPAPIRVARAAVESDRGMFPSMASALTGESASTDEATARTEDPADAPQVADAEKGPSEKPAPKLSLAERLAMADPMPSISMPDVTEASSE